jgi:hypothetical protein
MHQYLCCARRLGLILHSLAQGAVNRIPNDWRALSGELAFPPPRFAFSPKRQTRFLIQQCMK